MNPTKKLKKLQVFQSDPQLALLDELETINSTLEGMGKDMKMVAEKPDMEMPEMPDTHKVEIMGAEVLTIKGERGEKGETGEPGRDGKDGINGKDGKNGKDGLDGLNGFPGLDGKDGEIGLPGKDGSPDTGAEIVSKINELALDDELKIDAKHIKNFPKGKESGVGGGFAIKGVNAGTNISVTNTKLQYPVVTLNIPVQTSAPSSPVVNQLWIDSS